VERTVISPQTVAEVRALVAEVREGGGYVVPRGAGTRREFEPPLLDEAAEVDLSRLSGAPEVRSDNLTVTVPSGMALAELQGLLRARGLWFPVEHLDGPEASVGGCLAAGFANPLTPGFGRARDYVLGLRVVDASGGLLRLGSELVKNVAGYDLVRLHLGAWGRLGLLVEVVLKLVPLSEADHTIRCTFPGVREADGFLRAFLTGGGRPAAVEAVTEGGPDVDLYFRLIGSEAAVRAWQMELEEGVRAAGAEIVADAGEWERLLVRRQTVVSKAAWRIVFSLPTPDLEMAVALAERLLDASQAGGPRSGLRSTLFAHAASGAYMVCGPPLEAGASADDEAAVVAVEALRAMLPENAILAPQGRAAALLAGRPGWVSFPPRPPASRDRLEAQVVHALAPGLAFNRHLTPREAGAATQEEGSR
jgi:FAD/FMN-containing dehydrogenase